MYHMVNNRIMEKRTGQVYSEVQNRYNVLYFCSVSDIALAGVGMALSVGRIGCAPGSWLPNGPWIM